MDWEHIEKAYGFRIISEEKVRKISKLNTDQGAKCFKRAHASRSYFQFVFAAVDYLIQKGFTAPIGYDRTLGDDICIEYGEYIYYALPWIESRQCKFKRQEELFNAIGLSAELHKASAGFVSPEDSKPRIHYGKWPERFLQRLDDIKIFKEIIEAKEGKDDFDKIYYPFIDFFINQGNESIELIKSSSYYDISEKAREKGEFCHHDMAEHNFLITPSGEMKIIDFDYCIMDTRLHDIASLIIRNMKHGIWDIGKADFILSEYSKNYSISREEIEVIKYFIIFPQDFWQIGLQYYIEKQPWSMENFMSRLNNIRRDFALRQNFLQELQHL